MIKVFSLLLLIAASDVIHGSLFNKVKSVIVHKIFRYPQLRMQVLTRETPDDLLKTVEILKEQIRQLKQYIAVNKSSLTTYKKDKNLLVHQLQERITALQSNHSHQLQHTVETLTAKLENEKYDELLLAKQQFEEEKRLLIESLRSDHMLEINEVKRQLLQVETNYTSSENSKSILRAKLNELSEVHKATVEDFHRKDKLRAEVRDDRTHTAIELHLCND